MNQQDPFTPPTGPIEPGKGKAIASLVLGICAIVFPIMIVGVILGVVGIVLAIMAKREGYIGGMATAGLVCSIIGTVFAVFWTFTCGLAMCAPLIMW